MKNTKKLPTKQLEKFSTVFTQLGLVLVLFIVYITLEHQTEQEAIKKPLKENVSTTAYVIDDAKNFVFKRTKKPKPKVYKIPKAIDLSKIEKGDNDIVEISLPSDLNEDPIELFDIDDVVEIDIPEKIDDSEIPFINIEDAPIFKGCEGLSKEENKICFEKKIKKFVQRNFNGNLGQDIGLERGKHRIFTQFIINKEGEVVDIQVNAPHIKLKKEAQRIIDKIPKFTPGKQRRKPVKVRYILPITFNVD